MMILSIVVIQMTLVMMETRVILVIVLSSVLWV
jgi:hypothetical protein